MAARVTMRRSSIAVLSLGIAMFERCESLTGGDVIVDADLAMYDAKEAGRNGYAFFETDDLAPRPRMSIRAR